MKRIIFIIMFILCIGLVNAASTLLDDIGGYYKFDVDTTDAFGSRDATNDGATLTSGSNGIIGECYNYTTDDSITYPEDYDSLSEGSVSLWFKLSVATGYQMLASNTDEGSSSDTFYMFIVEPATPDYIYVRVSGGVDDWFMKWAYTPDLDWHHMVVTVNGSGNILYFDGSAITPTTYSVGSAASTGFLSGLANIDGFRTGNWIWSGSADYFLNGRLDEFAIWNTSLTPTQITELYNAGVGLQYPFSGGDETPPVLSNVNCTTPNPDVTGMETGTRCWSNDNTNTIVLDTDEVAICNISNTNSSYATICSTTNSTSHTCTYPSSQGEGLVTSYINCTDAANNSRTLGLNFYIDTINPDITFNSPASTDVQGLSVILNVTCADNTDVNNISFYRNNTLISTNTTPVNNTPWVFTHTVTTSTNYSMYFKCWDNVSTYNSNTTETRWFNFISRQLVTNYSYNSNSLYNEYCFNIVNGKQCLGEEIATPVTDNVTYWLCTLANCSTGCQADIRDGKIFGCT